MPLPKTSLPPELGDKIIQHLYDDKGALQSCALVLRTWSGFSQRALFRHAQVDLYSYTRMAGLTDDLTSDPHLQTLIRNLKIYQRVRWYDYQDVPFPAYMSRLTSVLSLLPNLAKIAFQEMTWPGDADDRTAYRDLIPNVLGSAPLVELDIGTIYTLADLQHAFEVLEGTNVKRISLSGFEYKRPSTIFTGRVRLPVFASESANFIMILPIASRAGSTFQT
ncbi:hypothetical protein CPB85DRAFT_584867 [Mucidula mucida]|nr:hypothetical protein CPB85DRAFT_584867 [Mucidula mucida]